MVANLNHESRTVTRDLRRRSASMDSQSATGFERAPAKHSSARRGHPGTVAAKPYTLRVEAHDVVGTCAWRRRDRPRGRFSPPWTAVLARAPISRHAAMACRGSRQVVPCPAAALSFASLVALDVSIMTIMAAGPATFPLDTWGRSLQSTLVRRLLRLGVHRPPCRQGAWAARVELILPWHALTVRLITGIYRPVSLEATAERTGDAPLLEWPSRTVVRDQRRLPVSRPLPRQMTRTHL